MTITKLGHCCLIIKVKAKSRTEAQASSTGGLTILTDPGSCSTVPEGLKYIDVILITDEHSDHLYIPNLSVVLQNNLEVVIFTNNGVGKILTKEHIPFQLLTHGMKTVVKDFSIEAFGEKHAEIYSSVTPVDVTGYFIANRFFFPGDAFTNPGKPVEILALPVAGPFVKVSDFMEYAKEIHPKISFPVHDGGLKHFGSAHRVPAQELPKDGIQFIIPEEGKEMEF